MIKDVCKKLLAKHVLISFVGPSGKANDACYEIAEELLKGRYKVFRVDVLDELRHTQDRLYRYFRNRNINYPDPGHPNDPAKFRHDKRLLNVIAEHFVGLWGEARVWDVQLLTEAHPYIPIAVINTDCRNGDYQALKRAGFVFIRVEAKYDEIAKVDWKRDDHKVEHNYLVEDGSKYKLKKSLEKILKKITKKRD